ncbi:DUF924 domain-containing protein [Aquincola sp. S2]|uniref:DUF924 domain-containing protein n=1 Tax=Pseudaquabacterium terrae TaxID=2732868 RepID=A0ABX2EH82_9BURK|nr:DUF924 family protein [Aquabacterium terrae]NRF67983.1 DUF924 domain-containing protein [Aquabacterium terrae]
MDRTSPALPPGAVLDFWFAPPGDPEHLRTRAAWFRKDPAFDAQIRERFGATIEAALGGDVGDWAQTPAGALAEVIVLDQFTRNVFRDSARAFAGDARALAAAQAMVGRGDDRALAGVQRQFVYLPFEHAEDLGQQREALRLFAALERDEPQLDGLLRWAQAHHDIIERFGRFPHRNAALGRASTAEEAAFLKTPGSGF